MASAAEESLLKTHTFTDTLLDCHVIFHIIKMKDSLFLWIGDQGNFDSLAVAMKTPYSTSPVASSIMGYSADDYSCSLASQLSERTKMQVFASYNLSRNDSNFLSIVAKRLTQEIIDNPNKF
ncbi:proteasome assembly chaperone 4 [Trichonephila inaurata madagascariensis]|uniref:Proteasome assembly chaperone 4 n=1 Tax=Trichonephila inaurata madagascariensis TaxID=2747483 RepID=A0A8X7CNJ6_9ARAC|nr:proteasome assembly chaperone 4 [Trichonephila inaurata madagascariensis]